jgi:hypothetical protein
VSGLIKTLASQTLGGGENFLRLEGTMTIKSCGEKYRHR